MSQASLSPEYYAALEQLQQGFDYYKDKSIEEQKHALDALPTTIPDTHTVNEVKLDDKFVIKSKEYIENGLKKYEDVLDENWKCLDNGLTGEWIRLKSCKDSESVILYFFGGAFYMGCAKQARSMTCEIAEKTELPVFTFDYRLNPQYEFPSQICDAVAAYLYLINPGPDSEFKPIDPKKIIFAGSSAGGGLAMGTALFIRDVGLPLPAGIVSPWVDLTASMPSYWEPEMDKTDHIPKLLVCPDLGPPCPMSIEYLERAKIVSERIKQKKPNVVGHPSFTKFPRLRLYCANEALAIPYVSPMLAESLGNLPPILVQVGGGDRLRDSVVLLSIRASDPTKYQIPKYATTNFENSPFKKPTEVTLELYDDACHCFQKTLNAMAINPNCEIREFDEKFMECLKWENIGVIPDVKDA
ncbi:11405_t:CDS:2 [Dentiscutata heterogama]|uniref:11405_t:CDS:1 n=1 Tax=Dentiscutata heterogama TaxID=1316150 RepID=A0ACA9NGS7_9GLOM|nr:11405_t:CDS:2 [Dentiscutata heterogama]